MMFNRFYGWLKVVLKLNQTLNELRAKIGDIQLLESDNQKSLSDLTVQVGKIQSYENNNEKKLSELKLQVGQIQSYVNDNESTLSELKLQYKQLKLLESSNEEGLFDLKLEINKFSSLQTKLEDINKRCLYNSWFISEIDKNIGSLIINYYTQKLSKELNIIDLDKLLSKKLVFAGNINEYDLDHTAKYLPIALNARKMYTVFDIKDNWCKSDVFLLWGIKPESCKSKLVEQSILNRKHIVFAEDGFLRSIQTSAFKGEIKEKYIESIAFTFDLCTPYYDSQFPSMIEKIINSTLQLNDEQLKRSLLLIDIIVKNKLTKYNHQPVIKPNIGRDGKRKILVVDQSYGDYSIVKGGATEEMFIHMLQCAIEENPDADIIVKTHPDTLTQGKKGGYFSEIPALENVFAITFEINPISLIEYVEHVYVVSTQLGFEAVMCGKKVSVFGLPFYSGWGITDDRQICARRIRKRSVEEIFYIAYIMYSKYVNPKTGITCEIEEAIDYLLELREEYNDEQK